MVNKVATTDRLDALRDADKGDVSDIVWGTDESAPTQNDDELGNQVAKKAATNEDGATGEYVSSATLSTAEANGNTLKEVGEEKSDGTLYSRIVHAEIDKDDSFELETRIKKVIQNA